MSAEDARKMMDRIAKSNNCSDRQAFTYASLADYVAQGNAMHHSRKRQEAQVDAMLKVKYDDCGQPDAYQPPEEGVDGMATLINCNFWGDESVQAVTKSIGEMAKAGETPAAPEQPAAEKPNGWSKWFKSAIMGAALLGAGGVGTIALQQFSPTKNVVIAPGDDTDTDTRNTIRPDDQP